MSRKSGIITQGLHVSRVYREAEMCYLFDLDFFHLQSLNSDGSQNARDQGGDEEARGRKVKYVVDAR